METWFTVFAVLVFLVFLLNTVALLCLFRQLTRSAHQLARYQHPYQVSINGLRTTLEGMQLATERVTEWSYQLRSTVIESDGDMARVDNWLRYGLAKIDFNVDRVSKELDETASHLKTAVAGPLYRGAAIVQGVKALLELVTLAQQYRVRTQSSFPPQAWMAAEKNRPSRVKNARIFGR